MEIPQYIDAVRREGERLVAAAAVAGLDAPVPSCPEWDVRELVRHMGGVHHWAAEQVRDRLTHEIEGELEELVGGWPPDERLLDWAADQLTALVDALEHADPTFEYFTFVPAATPLTMWARRQAHETAIHRVDAELAAGSVTPFEPRFAADGIDELLMAIVRDWDKEVAVERACRLLVQPLDFDAAWTVTIAPEGLRPRVGREGEPDCTVTGTAADLYRAMWHRGGELEIDGNAGVLDTWWSTVTPAWT